MQKKLLVLAMAGAFAAPLAAQAQGSNVTIYGFLKPSLDYIDNGDHKGSSIQSNNSLIGFSGSEDLGNGLKVIFQLESALEFDERGDQGGEVGDDDETLSDGAWVRRDSWVGMSGSFGSLVVGNMFPAYKRSTDFADPFGDSIGDYNNMLAVNPADADDVFNGRFRNAFHYISPKFGGFSFQGTYGLNGDADDDDFESDDEGGHDDAYSLAGTYAWGAFTLTAAYEDQGNVGADDGGGDLTAWKLGAGYKFGNTSLALVYEQAEFGEAVGDRDLWFVSVKHTMGKIDLMASYTHADDADEIDDSSADAFAIGVAYNFSKRTAIMGLYSSVSNDDNSGYGMDSGYGAADGEDDVSGFSVRLAHRF